MNHPIHILAEAAPGSVGWFWAAAATIIASLASAVAFMYKQQISMKDTEIEAGLNREGMLNKQLEQAKDDYEKVFEKLQAEIDECRRDREELRVEMARFETRITMLEKSDRATHESEGEVKKRLDDLENKK